ncbi:MAG: alpha/beta hydrolase [Mesorhizobium sp.]|nr:MAG: alpha/beta hydrolase [Mesorhizobium sp.]
MRPIETRYARSGDVRIAYQVVGQGSFDLVFVPGFISNLDLQWEDEGYSRLLKRLSAFSRLILFDKRGTGLSDRVDSRHLPSLETRMDDVRAVMDAAGSGRAAITTFWDDICSRAMTHKVDTTIADGANLAFTQACAYPDGTKVFCAAMLELKNGRIARQTVVQAWDE